MSRAKKKRARRHCLPPNRCIKCKYLIQCFLSRKNTWVSSFGQTFKYWVRNVSCSLSTVQFLTTCLLTIFLQIFGNCKNLIVCDGLVYWETCTEMWPKSFKKQRSYSNFKHLAIKTANVIFGTWTPNFRIFWIFENGSCSSRWEKSNGVHPIEIGLTVLEISGGGANRPPHQLTSSRKPNSNRVNNVSWLKLTRETRWNYLFLKIIIG